jgi:signal transduction histidine kinase
MEDDEDRFTIVQDWSPDLPSTVGTYSLRLFGHRAVTTLRAGRTFVANDVEREVPEDDGQRTFEAIGVEAIVCCALIKDGRLSVLMALHQDRPRVWTEEEIELLENVAERCWEAVERARAERALREANEGLERRVEARTEELTRANRDLDEFAYSVAHDIRAPLRAIVSTSRILIEDMADRLRDEEREALERQAKNGVRLARIVDDLLGFARLAHVELNKQAFDLSALARTTAEDVARRWPHGCAVEVQEGMEAMGDPSLVGYALTNLLDNACKFSPGGGRIQVGERDGVYSVRDEGVGFDMAHAHKLFVAFERLVDQETFQGTGVGLANVKRIVERHGGRIWAESEPGKGSTFSFTLA